MNVLRRRTLDLVLPSLRPARRRRSSYGSVDHALSWTDELQPGSLNRSLGRELSLRSRAVATLAVCGVVLGGVVLSWRLYQLQVSSYDRYNALAEGNRIRESIVYAPRGNIYDRNGRLLAGNTVSFQLDVTPYLLPREQARRVSAYERIGVVLGLKPQQIRSRAEGEGIDYPLPVVVQKNIRHTAALELWQFLSKLDGFSLNEVPARKYVADAGLAHIVGYTGDVSEAELKADAGRTLLPIDTVGKSGIEQSYDAVLRGQNGLDRTEVDTFGRPIRLLAQRTAQAGQDVTLTIDLNVQRRLAAGIREQMKKANVSRAGGVALDPRTGEVLALVSFPFYDNNLFANGISGADFARLTADPDQPLVNKAISGGYTTGSTIKPVVASAALQENVVTPDTIIVDSGAIAVTSQYQPGQAFIFRGWRPGGLGPMNVRSAIAMSSNIYFYTVGGGHGNIEGLGVERLTRYYHMFGLGELSGIDLPGEIDGRVPDPAWKQRLRGEDWYVGDTYNISIGQGDMLVSPLQLALANMAIANDGYLLEPHVVLTAGGQAVARRVVRREVAVDKSNLQIVREGMRQVLTAGTTCECVFANVPKKVAGKTGTAQTTSDETRRPHAWFTAYAPFDDPQFMAAVILEEGSGGSQYAAPAIAGAMETFFKKP